MAKRPLPTIEQLRQLLDYDPLTGKLFWKARDIDLFRGASIAARQRNCQTWNDRFAGREAFIGIDGAGYRQGAIFGHYMKAHRVAWAHYHGAWPNGEVGRDNGDNQDNRIWNLHDTDHFGVIRNSRMSKRNTSGVTGVSWNRKLGKWAATIHRDGKTVFLGNFIEFENAVSVRRKAEIDAGYHPRHGERRLTPTKFVPKSER